MPIPRKNAVFTILSVIGLVCLIGSPAAVAESIEIIRDVTYVERAGVPLKADIYLPTGDGPFPAALCVHGGAWRYGNKRDMTMAGRILAENGYTAVSIQYRLAPDDKFPAQIEDCREALRWMRRNAGKYKIDPKRIAGVGYSAGGHLVTLMGVTGASAGKSDPKPASGKPKEKIDLRLQAVVAGGAPCDFRHIPAKARWFEYWLGGRRSEKPDAYRDASPAAFVTADAPPTFFFHGEKDVLVRIDNPKAMAALLKKEDVPVEIHFVPDAGHISAFFDKTAYAKAVEFLDKHLKKRD